MSAAREDEVSCAVSSNLLSDPIVGVLSQYALCSNSSVKRIVCAHGSHSHLAVLMRDLEKTSTVCIDGINEVVHSEYGDTEDCELNRLISAKVSCGVIL